MSNVKYFWMLLALPFAFLTFSINANAMSDDASMDLMDQQMDMGSMDMSDMDMMGEDLNLEDASSNFRHRRWWRRGGHYPFYRWGGYYGYAYPFYGYGYPYYRYSW